MAHFLSAMDDQTCFSFDSYDRSEIDSDTSSNWYLRMKPGMHTIFPHSVLEIDSLIWVQRSPVPQVSCKLLLHFRESPEEIDSDGLESTGLHTETLATFSSDETEYPIKLTLEGNQPYVLQFNFPHSEEAGIDSPEIIILGHYLPPSADDIDDLQVGKACSSSGHDGVLIVEHTIGNGHVIVLGDIVTVWYTAKIVDTGDVYEQCNATNGNPAIITVGSANVIAGWNFGLVGMRSGGNRTMVIPPHLAFGEAGLPPRVPPNATIEIRCVIIGVITKESTSNGPPDP